ncbi:MAG: peptidoglycan D,D-transpeptidase FtsI family protein [Velocimicrobium sp.]
MGKSRRKSRVEGKNFTSKMQASLLFVFCIVILTFFGLVIRMLYLTNADGDRYEKRVLSQQTYVSNVIPYKRGDILDRNMTKLAVSDKIYNLILDPVTMLQKDDYLEPTVKALKSCFGIDSDTVQDILKEKSESQYVQMKEYKGLDYETVEAFQVMQDEDSNIKGVWFEEEYKRNYPLGTVGSSVIGFTQKADNNIGNWGIEEAYNNELSGTNGREYGYFNADLKLERTVKPAVNGNTIVSTIDANVQKAVEKKVSKYLKTPGAENVAVVLMNPQNGEIYAMVSNEAFDLNNPRDLTQFYTDEEIDAMSDKQMSEALSGIWRNYCISDAYEPGSTFKPFTVAAALDEDVVSEKSTFQCDGYELVADKRISCNVKRGHGKVTLKQALMVSCNVALMKIGAKLGPEKFAYYTDLFGFGQKTGIDLPGEASGIIYTAEQLNPVELATCSFGQSNTVTMTQMVAGFASLINGGNYYKPHIVKEILNDSGATVEKMDQTIIKKTVSGATSDKIRDYLYATVEEGTASPAKVAGYEIGGKTGTAEKIHRDHKNYIVSFIGFAPLDDPSVVIYVVIDQPHVKDQPHSTFATEFGGEIMDEVLPFLDVYKNVTGETQEKSK